MRGKKSCSFRVWVLGFRVSGEFGFQFAAAELQWHDDVGAHVVLHRNQVHHKGPFLRRFRL